MSITRTSVKSSLHAKAPLSPNGRIVIPAAIRQEMGFAAGDTLLMDVEDGVLRIESYPARIRRIQREFAPYAKPGVLASDELIAERREEARREEEEMARDREFDQDRLRKAGLLG
ncbi:MAG TPA: AbrB/MazE/SpoVT family DNA-binding domain-containing protein [Terracidiphilus sp.]|nr:AbrB/MazE/SpoVT family DNA-binding domain-containing protein [Terracidiphilus sp.]